MSIAPLHEHLRSIAERKSDLDRDKELLTKAATAIESMLAAMREVEWIFDGQEDITDNGGPNDAMRALTVLRPAITKALGAA